MSLQDQLRASIMLDDLAKERAKVVTLARLVVEAAEHLSRSRLTIGGNTVGWLEPRINRAATLLCQALIVADAELPAAAAIDLTEMTSILTIDGGNVA